MRWDGRGFMLLAINPISASKITVTVPKPSAPALNCPVPPDNTAAIPRQQRNHQHRHHHKLDPGYRMKPICGTTALTTG